MAKTDNKKRSWRDKYRFAIYNDKTYEEVWRIRMTRYNGFLLLVFMILFIVGVTTLLISFTNLREFIPGYPDGNTRRNIIMNALRLDSLEREIELRDQYFMNLNAIISGREPVDRVAGQDTTANYDDIQFNESEEDSLLRAQVEQEERYNLSLLAVNEDQNFNLSNIHFFPPVKGIVSGHFNPRTKHYGTDIVTSPKAVVSATLDGTVMFTGWTMETGWVIQIQHTNNLISVYKHNETLLKEPGDNIVAGEGIAVVGDSGELYTSGPHLHFEIWYKGEAVNPEDYLLF
ncbi:MAG TPA: M23 family metallopeptidase [Bacteroidales bacterium]|nr:M23 family metallopeptidase [Bacteroidales bacterium]